MQRKFRTDINFLNEQKQKLNVQRLIDALTDPDKVLNFPIKYPAIELDKASKQALYLTAGIISLGLILSATIKSK
jgi:hypothetical protein